MLRPLLLGLLCFSVLTFSACGEEDDDVNEGPDLTARIVGNYDGQYRVNTGGSFGPSYNGRALVAVSKIDNNTVQFASGTGQDDLWRATMTSETDFNAEGITVLIDLTDLEGSGTLDTSGSADELQFTVRRPDGSLVVLSFSGTRR